MIKAIVMDMDGTLLDAHNTIKLETKEALISLQEQGVTLILASGRSYTRLMSYAKDLKMDQYHGYLIEVDGVSIYDIQKNERHILRQWKLEEIQEVFPYCMSLPCESMACFDDGLFDYFDEPIRQIKEKIRKEKGYPDSFPWTAGPWSWLADTRDGYPNIYYIQSWQEIFGNINKIQIMQEEDQIDPLYKQLQNQFQNRYEIFRTSPRQIEILPRGISKGKTLEKLMQAKGWKTNEVLAFGDGENDVSLFEVVKESYAMGQAKTYVKEKAAHVTLSNEEQGILAALKEIKMI